MIASPNPNPNDASTTPTTSALILQGHMSDGIGATYGAEPCAVLTATADELWLKGNLGDFRIPRSAVVKLGRGQLYPWFFRGVRIRHSIAAFPPDLQFKPMAGRSREILAQLAALGFPAN
jgi:hypothetical protein